MTSRKQFKNRIRYYRINLGFTQTELAVMVGVSKNTISALETGQFCPTAYLGALLCEALQCKFEDLFYIV